VVTSSAAGQKESVYEYMSSIIQDERKWCDCHWWRMSWIDIEPKKEIRKLESYETNLYIYLSANSMFLVCFRSRAS
jgi:hypothetical protein